MIRTSIFDGISADTLRSNIAAAQIALGALARGDLTSMASYAQGDGNKSVMRFPPKEASIVQMILGWQTQLDTLNGVRINRRAPMRPVF